MLPDLDVKSTNKISILIILIVAMFCFACTQHDEEQHTQIKKGLQIADSLIVANKMDTADYLLVRLRSHIKNSDPLIITYYNLRSQHFLFHAAVMNLYADSALAFFSDEEKIKKYPDEYHLALLTKGQASVKAQEYISALDFYYRSKKVLTKLSCDNGSVDNKIGDIYFDQKSYKLAAAYWVKALNKLNNCHEDYSPQKFFFTTQGALDNIGIAYQRAGNLDSGKSYYLKDIELINRAKETGKIDMSYIDESLQAVCDNLGGLYLREKDYKNAITYLTKSLNLPVKNFDGAHITPLLKLADLYIKTGNDTAAVSAFNKSRILLNLYSKNNRDAEIEWNRLYAQFLFSKQQLADAYKYQEIYIDLKDSLENNLRKLYQLNIGSELNKIQDKQTLTELQQRNKEKKIYLIGFTIFVLLAIAIILMIYQILKKTKEDHKKTAEHNQQLQFTLLELEKANQNYIRIMRVMAHDLRNPLSGMTGLATMLLDEHPSAEESKHMLKLIESTGLHSLDMINELLNTGLADENESLQKERTDLNALLFDSVELLQFKAKEKQQLITFINNNVPLMADINYEKIWRVVNNLIVNAIKFSNIGKEIKADIKKEGVNILISVTDQGIGIPDENKESIFEMFTPAKKAGTDGEQPFGLGLSICKKIIESHNGRIWFESKIGEGTIFYIELPTVD